MHPAQYVLVELLAVQIWTPAPPPLRVQSRTACSMHGHEVEMFNFQAHSRGVVVRQVPLVLRAQTGTLTWQLLLPVHTTPPQCSRALATELMGPSPAPSGGSPAHWTKQAAIVAMIATRNEISRLLFFVIGKLPRSSRRRGAVRRSLLPTTR